MSSVRLPGKVLLPLPFPDGPPIIGVIIDQLLKVFHSNQIIVASSTESENDRLHGYCEEKEINCYRGSEINVLSRFIEIQQTKRFRNILRITADNPIIDLKVLVDFLRFHVLESNDYSTTKGLPLGMNLEAFKGSALLKSQEYLLTDFDKEHVTPALKREDVFKRGLFETGYQYTEEVRLTIDTVSDYLLVSTLLRIGSNKQLQGMNLVNSIIEEFSWIFDGNKEILQKNRFATYKEEVEAAADILNKLDYFEAARYLKLGFYGIKDVDE